MAFAVRLIALVCLLVGASAPGAWAEIPGVKMISATGISPGDAWSYYNRTSTGPGEGPSVRTNTFAAWSTSPPEIKALGQSLGAGRIAPAGATPAAGQITADEYTQAVFAYVRNNIEVEFRFGLGKGARGAVLDQSGTPFDQAELMLALLSEGQVAASYGIGTMTLTAQQFGAWTGLVYGLNEAAQTFSVDARAACRFLADGAIPLTIGGTSDCEQVSGALSSVTVGHAWVVVNGQAYNPSLKAGLLKAPKDVAAMMGCGANCGSDLVGQLMGGVESGSYSAGVPYYKTLNNAAVHTRIQQQAVALQTSLQTAANRRQTVTDVLGGATRSLAPSVDAPQHRWNLAAPSLAPEASLSGLTVIPDRLRTSLRIRYGFTLASSGYTGVDLKVYADEIAGRRVILVNANDPGGDAPHLLMDGVRFERNCNCGEPPILDVGHPYASGGGDYGDDTVSLSLAEQGNRGFPTSGSMVRPQVRAAPAALLFGLGDSSLSAQQAMSELQSARPMVPTGGCSVYTYPGRLNRTCRNDSQPVIALAVQAQSTLLRKVTAGVTGSLASRHHDVGFVYSSLADINHRSLVTMQTVMSVTNKTGDAGARQRTHEITAAMLPMVEAYAAADPTDPSDTVASPNGFSIANTEGRKAVFVTTAAQMSTIIANNFAAFAYAPYQEAADGGYSIVAAESSEGQLFYKPASGTYGTASVAYLLWGAAKGGGAPSAPDIVKNALGTLDVADVAKERRKYLDVSLSDGALRIKAAPDIVSGPGDFPMSLPFIRTYVGGGSERAEVYNTDYYQSNSSWGFAEVRNSSWTWAYNGPDQDVFARLGGGWTHNYQITATYTGNAGRVLGSNSALEASSTIATAVALNQIFSRSNPYDASIETFQGRLAALATVHGWSFGLYRNSVLVRKGAASEVFQRLPSGAFFNGGTASTSLVQTGEPSWFSGYYTYKTVTFLYTGDDGSKIRFDWSYRPFYNTNLSADYARVAPQFKALDWTFPSGVKLTFDYALKSISPTLPLSPVSWTFGSPSSYAKAEGYVLTAVRNNLGRRLDFAVSPYQNSSSYQSAVGYRIDSVSDENGRTATFARSCDNLLCDTFTVTDPNLGVTRYDYAATSYSPDPTMPLASTYRLREWFTPEHPEAAYQRVAYDALFRVKAVKNAVNAEVAYYPGGVAGTEPWKRGVVVSGVKDVTTTVFDENGSVLRSIIGVGAGASETVNAYDSYNRKIRSRSPMGQIEETAYDTRDNAIQTCLIPNTVTRSCSKESGDLVTSASYSEDVNVWPCVDPVLCNRMTSSTDARGKLTQYGWNTGTGELSWILQPADPDGDQPRIDLGYSSYAGVGGGSFRLLTSKTEAVNASTTLVTTYDYDTANKFVLKEAVVDSGGLALKTCFKHDKVGNLVAVTDPRATACP